jgi:glutamate:GABA antiporter
MKKKLGFFSILMINIIAVDSIRTLPFAAKYGPAIISLYIITGVMFLFPTALVTAELGTAWPSTGGIYGWIKEAFGKKLAFMTIWLTWCVNLIWFPTILALIASISTYVFNPNLAKDPVYILIVTLALFWIGTFLNCRGMRVSSAISSFGAVLGTLVPMLFMIVLGIIWVLTGHSMEISFSAKTVLPDFSNTHNLTFLSTILFGLLGLENAAVHAKEMQNPARDYAKATIIAACIILGTLLCSSLAIAIVVPASELNLFTSILHAFEIFFERFNMSWCTPLMAICIILGALSGVNAWIISPTKAIMTAAKDGFLPPSLQKANSHNAPVRVLILQAVIVSALSLLFVLMPSVNSSYWLLSIITAQLALIVYVILFLAAIKLHFTKPDVKRHFQIPGGKIGMCITTTLGLAICIFAFVVGFIPPTDIEIVSIGLYEALVCGGIALVIAIPFCFKSRPISN